MVRISSAIFFEMMHSPALEHKFRADLNGLRAIAVMSVLLFHFKIAPFLGGFVGVDVFFVISGFLMTQIIVGGLESGRFNLLRFYTNRIARIVPALLALAGACLAVGYFILPPEQYAQTAAEALKATTFQVNYFYAHDTGYFAPAAAERWFLHCWSLAVEFQFYILFPVCMWIAHRVSKKYGALALLLLLIPASMACSYWQTASNPVAAFYLLPSRTWEFAIGGLVLFLPALPARARNAVALLGVATIAAVAVVFNEQLSYPSLWSAFPVTAAAAILWARSEFVVLTNPLSQFLGKISYSLYLWHWPILTIGHYFDYGSTPSQTAVLVAATFVSAWASYLVIETPFRDVFRHLSWARTAPLAVAAAGLLSACIAIDHSHGMPSRISPELADITQRSAYHGEFRDGTCFLRPEQDFAQFTPNCFDPDPGSSKPKLAIWGSSHSAQLYSGIAKQSWAANYRIVQLTASACDPLPASVDPARPHCPAIQKATRAFLAQSKPDILIMTLPAALVGDAPMATVPPHVLTRELVQTTIRSLLADGVGRVIVVGPVPEWSEPLPKLFFRNSILKKNASDSMATPVKPDELANMDREYRATVTAAGASYISMRELMCRDKRCYTLVPNWPLQVLTQFDVGHLTEDASEWVAQQRIGPALGQHIAQAAPVPLNEPLEFSDKSDARKYLRSGWMTPEGWGTWTADNRRPGIVDLPIDRQHPPSALRVQFSGTLADALPVENFKIKINDDQVVDEKILQALPIAERVLPISAQAQRAMRESGRLTIAFSAPEGKSPKSLGINDDVRVLGLGLRALTLLP